eukprot:CAMPEP_0184739878 /NCGR_PEP_ID=MMETSP0315-20130426/2800_1 /TAXON_ID=101924 /ORGANISM="Rhodosorus marinus, Strain UTEX LB 2760" /LENGTH=472 /DNA_ID=CAMNT_0027209077 /DNA_START=155 /DNA_END=1573 /DNA_ORIENTATION=+
MKLTKENQQEAAVLLSEKSSMFKDCSPASLALIVSKLELFQFAKGEKFLEQGDISEYMYLMSEGEVLRYREESGVEHQVDISPGGNEQAPIKPASPPRTLQNRTVDSSSSSSVSTGRIVKQVDPNQHLATINSMHYLRGDPAYSSAVCTSTICKAYALSQSQFMDTLSTRPPLAAEIITSLQKEVREQKNALRTPFLELKHRKDINIPAVSVAAAIESYYRSALNAMLNARLLGTKAALFPNMHVQVPARVVYINGFKGMRAFLDRNVRPEEYTYPSVVRATVAVGPGFLMNPISSVLEASNAGHKNPESMSTRWMRGFVPRAVREVIFGIGLNQLSDWFEERWTPYLTSKTMANAAGSLTAGVIAGYLSHVPHNLSAYKLMEPHRTYGEHFRRFVDASAPDHIVPKSLPPRFRNYARMTLAVLLPRGCMIRTTQIVGSFMILNGTIGYLARLDQDRINRAFGESSSVPVVE